jgi:hypothetical protein
MAWLTSDLLADVRRSGMLPDSTPSGVADADILAHANKELQSRLLPLVNSVREEFYVQTVTQSLVAGQQFYRIPGRSIGNRLRDVLIQQSDGTQTNLVRLAPEAYAELQTTVPGPYPWAFYLESDSVMLVPTPSTSGSASLLFKYLIRPNFLVVHNDNQTPHVIAVTNNGNGTTTITHNGSAGFNSTAAGSLDIVSVKPPFRTVMISTTPTAHATGTITVATSALPSDFTTANFGGGANVGAVISAAETSSVVQLPPEMHNVLYQRTLCRVLQSIGDLESLQAAEANAQQMERDAVGLVANRTEGEPKKVVSRLLFQPRRRYGRWY